MLRSRKHRPITTTIITITTITSITKDRQCRSGALLINTAGATEELLVY
jgi:hypothetical protein